MRTAWPASVPTWLAALAMLVAGAGAVRADPGHEVTIARLTEQIALLPASAELYYQRAWNYRELFQNAEARADFAKSLELQPAFLPASRELARLDADEGHPDDGIRRLRDALRDAPAEAAGIHRRGCCAVLASLLLQTDRCQEALDTATAALDDGNRPTLDLCLVRSEAQRRLGRHADRVRDLDAARKAVPGFVLQLAWLEALIDAGRGEEALPAVQKELDSSRLRSSWLIRRARIRLQTNDREGAESDLREADSEIAARLRPELPDVTLLCDRGVIRALRGDTEAAAGDLAEAKARGADGWMTRTLSALLAPPPPRTGMRGDNRSADAPARPPVL